MALSGHIFPTPNFLEVIKEVSEVPISGNPLFRVVQKLKAVKFKLKDWNKNVFGRIDRQLKNAREEMYKIQETQRINWDDGHLAMREKETTAEYYRLMGLEENVLK